MVLNIQDKKNIIYKLKTILMNAISAVIVDFSGITVNQITEIRKLGREYGVQIHIVRNTLMRNVINDTSFECLKDLFIGPNLIAFSNKNPNAPARLLTFFAKKNTNLKIKAAAFEGKIIPVSQIENLVNMPNYEESVMFLISTIKEISICKLLRTLIAVHNNKKQV
ncbi:50S ribosomal protein L10 [Candidatus Mikella endobia]|uniref:Large ribosomal subunit protein uL10 n=1 Tax=Candidatus Mikella endobia TaxID=1778264 RepID=A0A143WPU3_9ENTR|nr:50S ribosomal protein L10 [Candidatus Mikella endobia]CUX95754.1 50S ribosomal protein L10 [Candidatus Mikella endobia]